MSIVPLSLPSRRRSLDRLISHCAAAPSGGLGHTRIPGVNLPAAITLFLTLLTVGGVLVAGFWLVSLLPFEMALLVVLGIAAVAGILVIGLLYRSLAQDLGQRKAALEDAVQSVSEILNKIPK